MYYQIYEQHEGFDTLFHQQCETAVQTVGLDYRSDILWEKYIEWELARKNLKRVTDIYLRLASVPTRLYNKHWDNFIAFVRDHHPRDILKYDEYEELRKVTCQELGLTYRPGKQKNLRVVPPVHIWGFTPWHRIIMKLIKLTHF